MMVSADMTNRKRSLGGSKSDARTAAIVSHMRLVLDDKRSKNPKWILSQYLKIMTTVIESDLY